jgi:hypothetical protein
MTRPTRPTIFELDGVGRPFNFNALANPTNYFPNPLNGKEEIYIFLFSLLLIEESVAGWSGWSGH